jgi:hypothetical protein
MTAQTARHMISKVSDTMENGPQPELRTGPYYFRQAVCADDPVLPCETIAQVRPKCGTSRRNRVFDFAVASWGPAGGCWVRAVDHGWRHVPVVNPGQHVIHIAEPRGQAHARSPLTSYRLCACTVRICATLRNCCAGPSRVWDVAVEPVAPATQAHGRERSPAIERRRKRKETTARSGR